MSVSIFPLRAPVGTLASPISVETSQDNTTVSPDDASARQLVAAMARGDEAAFAQLYAQYHSRLLRLALMLGRGDDFLAHDAVQAAFVIAAAKLRRVESEQHLWNWLAQIVRQQIARARRRQSTTGFIGAEELSILAGPETDSRLEEILDAALLGLETDEREIIERFYFDRLSHKQIAEELQITAKAVSSRLERARGKLRALINKELSHEA